MSFTQEGLLTVGIADCKTTANRTGTLVTYALGSCVGVVLWEPQARVGGMLHIMLPESKLDPAEAARNPYKFADTGIPALFEQVLKLGADKRRLEVWVAGGAQLLDDQKVFNIGQRNVLAAKKLLWKAGGLVRAEDTGGQNSRTMRLDLATGQVWIRKPGEPDTLMASSIRKAA